MLFVPLPFVVALLLALIFVTLVQTGGKVKTNRPFLALIALCVLQSICVGLRWGYGLNYIRYVLPVIAACLPPLTYASFRSLIHGSSMDGLLLPGMILCPLAVVILMLVFPYGIDYALIAFFVGYAIAIIALGRSGPDGLDEAQFGSAAHAHRALNIAACALCLSACFDLLVLLDFEWTQGENVAALVSNANLLGLFLIGLMAWVAAGSKTEAGDDATDSLALSLEPSPEDRDVLERLEQCMTQQQIYRDENLNLSRLSRRMSVPSRQISSAVNRVSGMNVSQYVNQHRIKEACRLLEETEQSVTAVMFASGFQTKSNFNREFRRVTGLTPVTWREREVWKLVSQTEKGHPAKAG